MSDLFFEDERAAHMALVAAIKSWKIEVQTYSCAPDKWSGNALRFATKAEADGYGNNLWMRWTSVRLWHSVPSSDAVNATWGENGVGEVS